MAEGLGTSKAGVLKAALALLEVALREKREGTVPRTENRRVQLHGCANRSNPTP